MLAQERYEIIIDLLHENKIVKVSELCKKFEVSIETIRRDLEYLEQKNKLKRIYGGAILKEEPALEPSYTKRYTEYTREKSHIGKETAKLVEDGDSLMIDLGTTTLEVARHLKEKKNLTIITNSMVIAEELVDVPTFRVILLGGILRPNELSLSGSISEQLIQNFTVDKTIIGAGGITADMISDYHLEEARVRRAMIESGRLVIAVSDHSKFGKKAFVKVCPTSQIDVMVTDNQLSHKTAQLYIDKGIEVIGYTDPSEVK
ncbi:DeoR/GlpR family DNA-binding transcription regulator [Sporosarcina sp. P33]|uniref:DeoR/GlpR family DNA-binding transcription regulator n=1 Tax=Sporosarcina sp. P33 TaxID=1930764 RepID=UPI0009C10118|nr:DeoR/GlpR family DNA-binding transcription regulator [Sporosarcina sp. P33]ARD48658.1 hypothetical protein SporoP33_10780 [Sporosarcina sp. P33]